MVVRTSFLVVVMSLVAATSSGWALSHKAPHGAAASAGADDPDVHPAFVDDIHNIWGAKAIRLSVFNRGHSDNYYGPGIFLERVLIPHYLEGEVTTALSMNSHGLLIPVDFLLKKPFNLHPRLEPFIGAGLALAIHAAGGHAEVYPGAIFSGGTSIWLGRHLGLTLELDYSIMAHHGVTIELELAAGAAWRFP